jgi:hypothetical protein
MQGRSHSGRAGAWTYAPVTPHIIPYFILLITLIRFTNSQIGQYSQLAACSCYSDLMRRLVGLTKIDNCPDSCSVHFVLHDIFFFCKTVKNPIAQLYYRWVVLCTVKDLKCRSCLPQSELLFFSVCLGGPYNIAMLSLY